MATKVFYAVEPIRHDGNDVPPGGRLVMDEKAAASLLAAGVISLPAAKPSIAKPEKASAEQIAPAKHEEAPEEPGAAAP